MRTENSIALKEWAAVCLALSDGRQSLLLRKGGIAEGRGGFRMEHDEFWLFPTQFHQSPEQLTPGTSDLLDRVQMSAPPPGVLRIDLYLVVKAVAFIEDESQLEQLHGCHVMSASVLAQRFHYRRPGLFVTAVEVFRRQEVLELADDPSYAGCHSWVDVGHAISTSGLSRVIPARPLTSTIALVETLGKR